eukprot:FR737334.1.p2 GENE.FR737334.1~~FR737334.1.p2  ORF type:complete len:170 (+),score=7.96 FR737334.1:88-597(+)
MDAGLFGNSDRAKLESQVADIKKDLQGINEDLSDKTLYYQKLNTLSFALRFMLYITIVVLAGIRYKFIEACPAPLDDTVTADDHITCYEDDIDWALPVIIVAVLAIILRVFSAGLSFETRAVGRETAVYKCREMLQTADTLASGADIELKTLSLRYKHFKKDSAQYIIN